VHGPFRQRIPTDVSDHCNPYKNTPMSPYLHTFHSRSESARNSALWKVEETVCEPGRRRYGTKVFGEKMVSRSEIIMRVNQRGIGD